MVSLDPSDLAIFKLNTEWTYANSHTFKIVQSNAGSNRLWFLVKIITKMIVFIVPRENS